MGSEDIRYKLVDVRDDDNLYNGIAYMWKSQKLTPPPQDVLSRYCMLATYEDVEICAVFLYDTGCSMAMMEFMIVNSRIPKTIRDRALDNVISLAVEWSENNGYKYVYTATNKERFKQRLTNNSFVPRGAPQQHMFWGLENG